MLLESLFYDEDRKITINSEFSLYHSEYSVFTGIYDRKLRKKGLKPAGVYIRQGTSTAPASDEKIRQMIKISDGDYYERMRSLIQDLTFEQARLVYKEKGIPFEKEHFIRLDIIEETGLYTNLGLLLSDQCMHTIKVAVFSDEAKTTFHSAKEFSGSVLTQLEDTYTYLMLCNQNRFQIDDLSRREYWDYPK